MKGWAKALLVVGALLSAGAAWFANDVHESNVRYAAERAEEDAVTISARFVESGCPAGSPLVVEVVNGSKKTLKDLHYELSVYESGRSEDISAIRLRDWTDILNPGERSALCFRTPDTTRPTMQRLDVTAKKGWLNFYGPGEFIPKRASASDGPTPKGAPSSAARPASRGASR